MSADARLALVHLRHQLSRRLRVIQHQLELLADQLQLLAGLLVLEQGDEGGQLAGLLVGLEDDLIGHDLDLELDGHDGGRILGLPELGLGEGLSALVARRCPLVVSALLDSRAAG